MTVRPAKPTDVTAIRELQALLDEPAPLLLDAVLNGLTSESSVKPTVGDLLVATARQERVVGYALAVPGGDASYLAELVVAPTARRDGHGARLVEAVAARGPGAVQVAVAVNDRRARDFYGALGFNLCTRLPDRFDKGDGLLLRRSA